MSQALKELFDGNEKWVQSIKNENPDFFTELAKGQSPDYLWIGCADSRVPANQVTGAKPGTIFVHRNIANMVVHTDNNMLSVLFYAATVLKVKHIIVCGHYGCGGAAAAMSSNSFGFIDHWLRPIKDVYELNHQELQAIGDEEARLNRFVELNVEQQVKNLAKVSFIQDLWKSGGYPHIHGLVYDLKEGKLKDLGIEIKDNKGFVPAFQIG